jgi:hypothetical protein
MQLDKSAVNCSDSNFPIQNVSRLEYVLMFQIESMSTTLIAMMLESPRLR